MSDKKQQTKEIKIQGTETKIIRNIETICGVCKKICNPHAIHCGNPQCPLPKKLYS